MCTSRTGRAGSSFSTSTNRAVGIKDAAPPSFELHAPYPNPSAAPSLAFDVDRSAHVRLEVFNVRGQRVATLVDRFVGVGRTNVTWLGTDSRGESVPSGVYFARMTSAGGTSSQRIVLVR